MQSRIKRSRTCTRTSLNRTKTPRITGYLALKAESNERYWRHILKSLVDCHLIDDRIMTEANNAFIRVQGLDALIMPSLISD